MKICLINSLYAPDTRGGAERIVQQQAELLRDAGHEVFVISTQSSNTLSGKVNEIPVFRVPSRNLTSFYNYTNRPLWLRLLWLALDLINSGVARRVIRIVEREKPDVIHIHNMRGLSYQLPDAIRKYQKTNPALFVFTPHDIQYAYPSGLLIEGGERFYDRFALRSWYESFCSKAIGSPDVVISPSEWLLSFYVGKEFFGDSQLRVVRNPINLPVVSVKEQQIKPVIRLLYVGQIEKHKGIELLLRAEFPDSVELTIVGTGSHLKKAQGVAEGRERIHVVGKKEHAQLGKYYQQSDIVLFPTLTYENLPTVILEAFSYGVPVIASRLGGVPELVEENKTGWLFKAGDGDEFNSTLVKAINEIRDANKRTAFENNCKQKISDFSSDKYLEKILEIYREK